MPHRRVLTILHTESSLGWGGQEFRILLEAAALRKRGHRLLIAAAPDGHILKRAQEQGFETFTVPFKGAFHLPSIIRLRGLLTAQRVDVLNTHSSIDSWCGGIAACFAPRVRVVRTRHLSIPVKRNLPTRWVYTRAAHAIITTGEALREQMIRDNGFDGSRIVSIPTGADLERFDPALHHGGKLRTELGIADDEQVVGTIAMLRRMKGHHVLFDALAAAVAELPRLRLVLVGDVTNDSPVKAELKAQAERLGIAGRVVWAGYREDIPAVLAGLDCVVLPSTKDEGVPQSLTQALAMGRPAIATAVGAIGEIIQDGRTGLLVPPNDAPALARALVSVFADPQAAQRRAAAGQALVRSRYSVAAMADQVETLFDRLCAER
jgi:glycosyltransferase involved in cell wall biosynthesis